MRGPRRSTHDHSYQLVSARTFQYFQWQIQHASLKLLRSWKIESPKGWIIGLWNSRLRWRKPWLFLWKTPSRIYLLNLEVNAPMDPHMTQCRMDLERGLLMFVARGWHTSTFPDSMVKMLTNGFIFAKIIFSLTRLHRNSRYSWHLCI